MKWKRLKKPEAPAEDVGIEDALPDGVVSGAALASALKGDGTDVASAPARSDAPVLAILVSKEWHYYSDGVELPTAPLEGFIVRVAPSEVAAIPAGSGKASLFDQGKRLVRARPVWVKTGGFVFFAPLVERTQAKLPVVPVAQLLTDYLDDSNKGVVFKLPLADALVGVAVYRRNRELTGWTISRREDVDSSTDQLMRESGLGDARAIELPNVFDLPGLSSSASLKAYPTEDEVYGIPVRTLRKAAMVGAVVLGVVGVLDWMGAGHAEHVSTQALATAQQHLTLAREQAAHWNRQHVDYVAHKGSVDPQALITAARAVSMPGGRVQIDRDGKRLVVYLPLVKYSGGNRAGRVDPAVLKRLEQSPPPKGWRFAGVVPIGDGSSLVGVYVKEGQ